MLRKPSLTLEKKLKISNKITSIVCLLLFYGVVGYGLFLITSFGYTAMMDFVNNLQSIYAKDIANSIINIIDYLEKYLTSITDNQEVLSLMNDVSSTLVGSVTEIISSVSKEIVSILTKVIQGVPETFVKLLLTIISTFFISLDYKNITSFFDKYIKKFKMEIVHEIKNYVVGTVFVCIKSYAIILGITFIELLIGLNLLRINNAVIIAFGIAILDILPVVGTGTVLIPWTIFSLVTGDISLGIGILIVYIAITVIRNIIEPKIVGTQLGLHPLITLISMFIGVNVAGILGLFGFPIGISLILYLLKSREVEV